MLATARWGQYLDLYLYRRPVVLVDHFAGGKTYGKFQW
jgi:hypothetical protein